MIKLKEIVKIGGKIVKIVKKVQMVNTNRN